MSSPLRAIRRLSGARGLHSELEVEDVAVLDDVLLPLLPESAGVAGGGVRPQLDELVVRDRLGPDEASLEVAVDDTRGDRRRVADADRPGADLLLAGGEVGPETEELVRRADQGPDARLLDAE